MTNAIYAALLTPQGKFLHDLFIIEQEDSFLIDCEAARAEDLISRLTAYKLRSKTVLENLATLFDVWAIWNGDYAGPLSFIDPRLPELGSRAFLAKGQPPLLTCDFSTYDEMRLGLGIADGSRDMEIEKSTVAEGNFDCLNGVDWKKGCYIGQELTARMHYRGLAKKRLFPVVIEGKAPPYGALLDKDVGEMRSSCGSKGLALLRIDSVRHALDEKSPLTHGETRLWPSFPPWMKIDATPVNR
jgi:folate-binding protein YgfZ